MNTPHSTNAPLPADYLAFCKAASVTVCLYSPSGVNTCQPSAWCADYDPLITDKALCTSEGGVFNSGDLGPGCGYFYPLQYSMNFNPGPPTTQGQYNVRHTANCPSRFTVTVDPHGAVEVTAVPVVGTSCVVDVFVGAP